MEALSLGQQKGIALQISHSPSTPSSKLLLLSQEHYLPAGKKRQDDATSLPRGFSVPEKIKWTSYTLISEPLISRDLSCIRFPCPF